MTATPKEIVAALRVMRRHTTNEAADALDRQAAEIAAKDAEIARLRAGGCARDQGLTQYCAEATAFAAEVERLRTMVELLTADRDAPPKSGVTPAPLPSPVP